MCQDKAGRKGERVSMVRTSRATLVAWGRWGSMTRKIEKGSRSAMRNLAADLVARAPQAIREKLEPHMDTFCQRIVDGMEKPTLAGQFGPVSNPAHRTAMDLYARIMGAVAPDTLVVNLWQRVGARDEQHARQLVGVGLDAEQLAQDDMALERQTLAWLNNRRKARGESELLVPVEGGK